MRKLAMATAAAAFGAMLAAPAMAQDCPFAGGRVEALAGYDNVQDGGDGSSEGTSGFTYGGLVGYDFQRGNTVFGLEGELTDATTSTRTYNALAAGDRFSVEAGRDIYLGGRIGAVIDGVLREGRLTVVLASVGQTVPVARRRLSKIATTWMVRGRSAFVARERAGRDDDRLRIRSAARASVPSRPWRRAGR